jgi:hypothetical protein
MSVVVGRKAAPQAIVAPSEVEPLERGLSGCRARCRREVMDSMEEL